MGDHRFSRAAYAATEESVRREGGSATARGEQRHREGKGLDPLVDPKGFGVIRRSLNRLDKKGDHFVLNVGQAMLKETRFDTTGSMGNNVQIAFNALPRSYNLLKEIKGAPLGRYDLQIINAIFGDVRDNYVLCRSQAEMCEKIAEQLRLMVPEGDGDDPDEDPDYGIFGAAYLTAASIVKTGLKSYDFTVTDARGRGMIDVRNLERVFGDEVFDRVRDNGHTIKRSDLPNTKEVVRDLLKIAHAFVIQVGSESSVTRFWSDIYGRDRVVIIPDVRYLPEVEAVIIGLTEGTLDIQGIKRFLIDDAMIGDITPNRSMVDDVVKSITQSVARIPVGAQAALPNFDKIPMKGARFKEKTDVWPMSETPVSQPTGRKKSQWI